jgi:hypothetical protein
MEKEGLFTIAEAIWSLDIYEIWISLRFGFLMKWFLDDWVFRDFGIFGNEFGRVLIF